ncbi:MAG: GNAT family N-acetyltransferase [Nanoarchaeota archaeon]
MLTNSLVISAQKHTQIALRNILAALASLENLNFGNSPLHQPISELERMVTDQGYVFVGAYSADELVGYCAGSRLGNYFGRPLVSEYRLANIPVENVIYVESFEILPALQKKGIGASLFRDFLNHAKAKAFSHVAGHAREGICYTTVRSILNNKVLTDIPVADYRGSGETYHYLLARIK